MAIEIVATSEGVDGAAEASPPDQCGTDSLTSGFDGEDAADVDLEDDHGS